MGTFVRLMMVGYYIFIAGLCLSLVALLSLHVVLFVYGKVSLALLAVPFLVTGAMLLQFLIAGRVLFWPLNTENPLEIKVAKKLIKPVVQFVNNIAEELKLPQPDEVRLCAHDAAYVYEDDDGAKILVLGGMIVGSYTQESLGGVIAHELAHFDAGDTTLSRQAFRTALLMAAVEEQFYEQGPVCQVNPLVWVLRAYHWVFGVARAAHSREQEYQADQATVELVGAKRAAATLMRLELTESMPWLSLHSMAESAAQTSQPLTRIFKVQRERASRLTAGDWEEAYHIAMRNKTGMWDTHPCLRDRLKAVGASPKKTLEIAANDDGAPARALFPDWDTVEQDLSIRLMAVYGEMEQMRRDIAAVLAGRPL
jgi:Zn-dependent protease with chaperone function